MGRAQDWLRQAENDLLWAEHSFRGGFFAQSCFIYRQGGGRAGVGATHRAMGSAGDAAR